MSPRFLLPCSCGLKISISKSQAGQEVTCSCGKRILVPTLREIAKLSPADENVGKSKAPTWNEQQGLPAAIMLGLAILAAIWSGLKTYSAYQYIPENSLTQEIASGDKEIDSYAPGELLETYTEFRNLGIGRRQPPGFAIYQRISDQTFQSARLWGIIAASLVAAALLVIFVPRLLSHSPR